MKLKKLTPIVACPDFDAVRDFYARHFDCSVTYEGPMYLGLRAPGEDEVEFGFLRSGTSAGSLFSGSAETPDFGPGFNGEGLCIGLQVEDVDAVHASLVASGAEVSGPPQDCPYGERSFNVMDPNGTVLHLFHPIEMQAEHQAFVQSV